MTRSLFDRATALLTRIAVATTLLALAATVTYTLASLRGRPWDTVEGEILFEAERIRRGLPLYVDPVRGALDYGPVPARFYVLYPPVWSWLLSHVPAHVASVLARALDATAWFGLLGWIAWRADPACRRVALVAAAFAASVFTLTLFAVSGRPDALALLLAGLALERSARKGRVDVPAAIAFALAPWVKPNVMGLAVGAFLVDLAARPHPGAGRPAVRPWASLAAALAVTGAMGVVVHLASGGAWLMHLLRSTGQPLSLPLWIDQVVSRLPFFGVPFAFAAWCGWPSRTSPGVRLALGALATSTAWAVFSFAKIGSATNYCLEPAVAAVILLARAPLPTLSSRRPVLAALAVIALAQSLWCGVASMRSSYEEIVLRFPAEHRALAHARRACDARPGDLILGDETGIELALDDRIVATPFQMTHLVRRGLYPLAGWIADVQKPQIVGIVVEDDLLERPPSDVRLEHDRFGPELRSVLRERFALAETNGDWRTYCQRR